MHPIVGLVYFTGMLFIGMTVLHPIMLAVTLFGGISLCAGLRGARNAAKLALGLLAIVAVSAIINPVFNHRGVTILFYGIGSNPVTLEAIVYGLVSGFMLAGTIAVFSAMCNVMTDDKVVFLFGRAVPSFALLISMTLRFAAVMKERIMQTFSAQRCLYKSEGIYGKLRLSFAVISAVTGHIIESSLDAAGSMKARGYGLPGRTSSKLYSFTGRDAAVLCIMLFLLAEVACGMMLGGAKAAYYPYIKLGLCDGASIAVYIGYAIFGFLPTIINFSEDIKWKRIESKI